MIQYKLQQKSAERFTEMTDMSFHISPNARLEIKLIDSKNVDWRAAASHEDVPNNRKFGPALTSFDMMFYTGWTSLIASRPDCVFTSFSAYTARRARRHHIHICPNCVGWFLSLKEVAICGLRAAVN